MLLAIILLPIFLFSSYSQAIQSSFENLLNCNLNKVEVVKFCDVQQQLELYRELVRNNSFYEPQTPLESWIEPGFDYYTNINPLHRIVLDTVKSLNISTICEIGAGAGKISKYVYYENPNLDVTCVELNQKHIDQMIENFQTRTHVISPDVKVSATIIQDSFPDISKVESNKYDLVFTHKIMMHLPFVVAVKSAENLVRVAKKYILHVENKNQGGDWYSMTIIRPIMMSPVNWVGVDYCALYEKLGVKTIRYYEVKDPESPATYVVYLGEKISQ